MTKAVHMGTEGFPPLLQYWVKTFEIWQGVVDKVYITINNDREWLYPWFKKILSSEKIVYKIIVDDPWPFNIEHSIKETSEDIVLVVHNDTIIHNVEVLEKLFQIAQDFVVSPLHQIYEPAHIVRDMLKKKYSHLPNEFSFPLYFIFFPRKYLEQTDMDFGGFNLYKGEYSELLGGVAPTGISADLGFKLCLQFLAKGIPFQEIRRYQLSEVFLEDKPLATLENWRDWNEYFFSREACYIHMEGMSGLLANIFNYDKRELPNIVEHQIDNQKEHYLKNDFARKALIMRLAWFREWIACDAYGGIRDYIDMLSKEINYIIDVCRLQRNEIVNYQHLFHQLIWKD